MAPLSTMETYNIVYIWFLENVCTVVGNIQLCLTGLPVHLNVKKKYRN